MTSNDCCPVLKVLGLTQILIDFENLQIGVNGLPVQLVRAELGSREGGVLSFTEVFLNLLPQSCRLSTGPPSIRMGFSSAFVPRKVPWNLELSPVLLCFRLSATSNRSASSKNNGIREGHTRKKVFPASRFINAG